MDKHALECVDCKTPMHGITSYQTRQLCEKCGGNDTDYHEGNPHPENFNLEKNNGR